MAVADAIATNGPFHALTSRLRQYAPGSDVGLALGVVALLSVLVLPLPTMLLDLGLAISITSASVLFFSTPIRASQAHPRGCADALTMGGWIDLGEQRRV